jgi:hypothetical protein
MHVIEGSGTVRSGWKNTPRNAASAIGVCTEISGRIAAGGTVEAFTTIATISVVVLTGS